MNMWNDVRLGIKPGDVVYTCSTSLDAASPVICCGIYTGKIPRSRVVTDVFPELNDDILNYHGNTVVIEMRSDRNIRTVWPRDRIWPTRRQAMDDAVIRLEEAVARHRQIAETIDD